MSIVSIIILIAVILGVVLGALTGFFRKFHGAPIGGVAILLTLAVDKIIGSAVKKTGTGYGWALLVTVVVSLLIFTMVVAILQSLMKKAVNAKLQLSHYRNQDNLDETEAYILSAVDSGDKREYKRQLKRLKKIKDSAGGWGVVDRILGAVNGAINVLVAIVVVVSIVLLFADISGLGAAMFQKTLESSAWTKFGKAIALDLPLISVISLSIRSGFKGGICSVLSVIVVLAMLVGFGFAAFSIASSEACAGAVTNLANGSLLSGVKGMLGDKTELVAKIIIAALIYVLSLIVVVLVGIFLPKVIDRFREGKVFGTVDGVLGAIVLCVVVSALFLVFGGVAASLKDVAFMDKFNSYEAMACFGDAMYSCNPMASVFANLPFAGWFAAPAEPAPESALALLIG